MVILKSENSEQSCKGLAGRMHGFCSCVALAQLQLCPVENRVRGEASLYHHEAVYFTREILSGSSEGMLSEKHHGDDWHQRSAGLVIFNDSETGKGLGYIYCTRVHLPGWLTGISMSLLNPQNTRMCGENCPFAE